MSEELEELQLGAKASYSIGNSLDTTQKEVISKIFLDAMTRHLTDGEFEWLVERPRFFNSLQRELRWLQRKLKNKTAYSANYRKTQHKISRLHERIYDTRKLFHINIAHTLCNGAGMIFALVFEP